MWWMAVALAGNPGFDVVWKGDEGRLLVRPPQGEHVADEAPLDVDLSVGGRGVRLELMGADLEDGVDIGAVRGRALSGDVRLSLCEDGGTRCRLVEVSVKGMIPDAKRGAVALSVGAGAGLDAAFPARQDALARFDAAAAESRAQGAPLLVEFGAIWCPPCNLMAVEVFHARPRPAVVDGFVFVTVDVDDPSSWTLKDQFHVGGYPTTVAIGADGVEIGRLVGYPGLDATVAWLDDVLTGAVLRPTGAPPPEDAARLAWRFLQEGRDDEARTWLAAAAPAVDATEYRMSRLALEPSAADVVWLAARAPELAYAWVPHAIELARSDENVASVVLGVLRKRVLDAPAIEAADLLEMAAGLMHGDEALMTWTAGARLVRDQLTGDPAKDKGWYGSLSWMLEKAGEVDAAVAVLEDARRAFPKEPTFHAALARLFLRQGDAQQALGVAEAAYDAAWGDNRLTSARLRVEALMALGRKDEARRVVKEVLAEQPEPPDGADVRAHRYREQLRALVGDGAR